MMIPKNVIYTDGHDVIVTDSTFQVKHDAYHLKGITRHGLRKLKPKRLPGALLILTGLTLGLLGYFTNLPSAYFADFSVLDFKVSANAGAIWLGGLIMIGGVLVLGLLPERYAVRIETAEGEKDVVVSTQQEYVQQIIQALNRALHLKRGSNMKLA